MNNTQLDKMLNNKNGFWVRLKDVDDNEIGQAAKIVIDKEGLTLFTLLDEAPAINVYSPDKFVFLSTEKDVILRVDGEGFIYDWYGPDCGKSPEEYTDKFLRTWELNEEEFDQYSDPEEAEELIKLKILRVNQSSSTCEY